MGFLNKVVQVLNLFPVIVTGVEAIYKGFKGEDKQKAVIDLATLSIDVAEAISKKDIVDNNAFQEGLKMVNDGVVKMLNASVWHKGEKK